MRRSSRKRQSGRPGKRRQPIEKIPTGVAGLDEVLEGGVPAGRCTVLCGSAGTGKTILLEEFLYRGAVEFGESGVLVTLEERPEDMICNVAGFGWDFDRLIDQGALRFVDASPAPDPQCEIGREYDLSPLVTRIRSAVDTVGAGRVAIDGLAALHDRFANKHAIREVIYRLFDELKSIGVTTLVSIERNARGSHPLRRYDIEEFIADGAVELNLDPGEQRFVRTLFVRKLRGVGYRSGVVEFEITPKGIRVFPKLAPASSGMRTIPRGRLSTGIETLDRAMHGGIPRGHALLVTGNTGTGKSLLCLQFLNAGLSRGEKAVFVAMEEPVSQVLKTAAGHGWNLRKYHRDGALEFLAPGLIDLSPDKILCDIRDRVEAGDATRVVFDSVSSVLSASLGHEQVRQFLIQLTGYFKSRGVTCAMSYLSPGNFAAAPGQLLGRFATSDLRLSSVTDAIVVMRYVEREQSVGKLLNILKLRGSDHSREILRYRIARGGIRITGRYER